MWREGGKGMGREETKGLEDKTERRGQAAPFIVRLACLAVAR